MYLFKPYPFSIKFVFVIFSLGPGLSPRCPEMEAGASTGEFRSATDVYEYCLKNSGPVKARPSDFEFAVHEISNNGELAEELEEFGIF